MSNDNDLVFFDAAETTLSIAGLLIESGFADGEYLSIEPQTEDFTDKVGATGSVVVSRTNDRRATIKLKLQQTSPGNAVLTGLRNLGLSAGSAALNAAATQVVGVGAFLVRDRATGVTLAYAPAAWVMKPPTLPRGREAAEYEWTLRVGNLTLDYTGRAVV